MLSRRLQGTLPSASRPNSPPRSNVIPILTMDGILRRPHVSGDDEVDRLKAFPPWSLAGLAKREFLFPIPEITLFELEARFQDCTRLPCIKHDLRLELDSVRIEKTPPYWIRTNLVPRPFDPTEFTPQHEVSLARKDQRLPSALETIVICLALPSTGLRVPPGLFTLVTSSKTVRGEYIVVRMRLEPGNVPDASRPQEIYLFGCSQRNVKEYNHIVVSEGPV